MSKTYVPEDADYYPSYFALGCEGEDGIEEVFREFFKWWETRGFPKIRGFRFGKDNDFSTTNDKQRYLLVVRPYLAYTPQGVDRQP